MRGQIGTFTELIVVLITASFILYFIWPYVESWSKAAESAQLSCSCAGNNRLRLSVSGGSYFAPEDPLFGKSVLTLCNCRETTVNMADVELNYQLAFPCAAPAGVDGPTLRVPYRFFGRDLKPKREIIFEWNELQQEKRGELKPVEPVKLILQDGSNHFISDSGRATFSILLEKNFESNYTQIINYVSDGPLCAKGEGYRASLNP